MKKKLAFLLCFALMVTVFPAQTITAHSENVPASSPAAPVPSPMFAAPVSPPAAKASPTPASAFKFDAEYGKITGLTDEGKALTELVIPAKINGVAVTKIGDCAFCSCTSLTNVTIPNSVTTIGDWAFEDCTSLASVTIPDSVTSIGWRAFYNTAYYNDTANWTSDVLYLGKWLIKAKDTLSGAYKIKSGTVGIAGEAFFECTSLTSVTIGNSVTSIGNEAFRACTSLTSVTIPDSVTQIGYYAFGNTAYYNDTANWTGDVLYLGKWLITAKNTLSGAYKIKSGTVGIADAAFWGCTSLTSVSIGNSVTEISGSAFCDCTSLTSVTIPNSVTSIGGGWSGAFENCTSLTSVTIPNSVTEVDEYAFDGCTSLTDVYYAGTEAQWKAIEIYGGNDPLLNATIHYNCAPSGIKKGDVTGDGVADNMDAAKILQYDAGLIGATDALLAAGDVTGDGAVDNMDAAKILKFDAGLISSL